MALYQSIILGLVQGLAEFLPISSSAHLVLIPWLAGWPAHSLPFDIALHTGTLVSLAIYFRKDWLGLIKGFFRIRPQNLRALSSLDREAKLALYIILATIPGAIIGFFLEDKVERLFRSPNQIALMLAALGILLFYADNSGNKTKTLDHLTLKEALLIGFAQGIAVIPGISRAGITITVALFLGFTRSDSAKFSFYLSLPIILGASILGLRHLTLADLDLSFWLGVATAAIAGYLAIGALLRLVQTRSYTPFVFYRIAVAMIVLLVVIFSLT